MHPVCLFICLTVLACTDEGADSGAELSLIDSSLAAPGHAYAGGRELIPAEWTVFEDTSATGEITTASLQLPAAKEIKGLLREEGPRLVLRCVDGKVEASINTEPSDAIEQGPDSNWLQDQAVEIQLDSAPACE